MILSVDPAVNEKKVAWAIMNNITVYKVGIGYDVSLTAVTDIIVESQYFDLKYRSKPGKKSSPQSVIRLAQCAGRWEQIADDLGVKCHFVSPLIWMQTVLGKACTGKELSDWVKIAIVAHYPTFDQSELTEDQRAAIAIGIWHLTKNWTVKK